MAKTTDEMEPTVDPVEDAPKPKKKAVAKHQWLDGAGEVTGRLEEAAGYRYTNLASGTVHEYPATGDVGSAQTMAELFGIKTKCINDASQARQKGEDQDEALTSLFADLAATPAVWRERKAGGGTKRKYDQATLAQAIVDVAGENAKGDVAHYVARLAAEKGLVARVASKTALKERYNELMGIVEDQTLDSVL